MHDTVEADEALYKALADANRLRILDALLEGERCACVLLERLEIAQSTLSHHMKILCASGLVEARENGKWTYYALSASGCARARAALGRYLVPGAVPVREAAL